MHLRDREHKMEPNFQKGVGKMVELSGSFVGVNLRNVFKSLCILLPVLLFCVAAGAPVQNEAPLTPEDSLRMVKEAEQYAGELETALDGTEGGHQRFMLAAEKLVSLGKIATPAFLRLIASKNLDPWLRKRAIELATVSRDQRAMVPLIEVARDTTNPAGVRDKAAYCIGYIGTDKVVDSLLVFIESDDRLLKSAATTGIRIASNYADVNKAFEPIVRMANNTADEGLRKNAIAALGYFGDRGVPLLVEFLEDDNKEIRPVAIGALGYTRSRAVVKPLVELLSSEDVHTRIGAIMSLQRLGDTTAVPALIEVLTYEGDDAVFAAMALAKIGDPRALEPLKEHIDKAKAEGRQPSRYMINAYEEIKKGKALKNR
ncbi:HEAT repeat domain-containing protein [candidate division TA06 bacterium]|uniref:HEAT repeat domain-containing protein n=1 Tax=candidate division TA06 bacterium TaxID=2250710 RepID=A0A523UQE6_UNCT6|nr:MAG: HEAT repeat domain-containing protein [candidate division TA06 bacterium]